MNILLFAVFAGVAILAFKKWTRKHKPMIDKARVAAKEKEDYRAICEYFELTGIED